MGCCSKREYDVSGEKHFDLKSVRKASLYLESWYGRFTLFSTLMYVKKVAGCYFIGYTVWALLFWYLKHKHPEIAEMFQADFTLKVLTFLVGLLISLTLKEALDRYRSCLAYLIDFRDEYRSFWYFTQVQLMDVPAARVLVDIHMVCYAVSLIRFLLRKGNIRTPHIDSMVQPEFKDCVLFQHEGTYSALCSNPAYAELVLVAWLRTVGLMDRDLRVRFQWARQKLHQLLTAQRVRSPRTSVHLLRGVVILFLCAIPVCSASVSTKIATPIISLVLFALLSLAEELEDPFGLDDHDLPWPILLGTVLHCTISESSQAVIEETIAFFNHGCTTGNFDLKQAERLFGKGNVVLGPVPGKPCYDGGKVNLSLYPTADDLKGIDIVGNAWDGDPDILFAVLVEEHV